MYISDAQNTHMITVAVIYVCADYIYTLAHKRMARIRRTTKRISFSFSDFSTCFSLVRRPILAHTHIHNHATSSENPFRYCFNLNKVLHGTYTRTCETISLLLHSPRTLRLCPNDERQTAITSLNAECSSVKWAGTLSSCVVSSTFPL